METSDEHGQLHGRAGYGMEGNGGGHEARQGREGGNVHIKRYLMAEKLQSGPLTSSYSELTFPVALPGHAPTLALLFELIRSYWHVIY